MSHRSLFTLALILMGPASAAAQFTTFIPPKNAAKDSVKAATVAQQRAKSDSITTAALTNMKTWVDSAAGVVVPATDTAAVAAVMADTTPLRSGVRAPATASPLPLLALLGALALAVGGLLLGGSAEPTRGRGA